MVSPAWLNKQDPDDKEVDQLILAAGMQKFLPMFFSSRAGEAEERPSRTRRTVEMTRRQWVGAYYVEMRRRQTGCLIRMYVYLFRTGALALKATWSGTEPSECDRQFQRTIDSAKAILAKRPRSK